MATQESAGRVARHKRWLKKPGNLEVHRARSRERARRRRKEAALRRAAEIRWLLEWGGQ